MEKINKLRSSRRLPYQNEIEIVGTDVRYCKGKIINISLTGLCIESETDLPINSQIISRITLGSEVCELKGKVAWSTKNQQDDKYRIGIELERIPDEFAEIYQQIIKKFFIPEKDKSSVSELNLIHKV